MQPQQAPRVTANPFSGFGSKLFLCLFLLAVLMTSALGEIRTGGATVRLYITPSQLPIASVSAPYSAGLDVSRGTEPYRFTVVSGTIPPGLSLNTLTGTVAGRPTTAGSFSFRVTVSDSTGNRGEGTVYITVSGTPVVGVTISPSNTTLLSGGTQQFSANVTNSSNRAVTLSLIHI